MILRLFIVLLAAASAVLADLSITTPAGGDTVANTALSVTLAGATSGKTYVFQIFVGGTTEATSAIAVSAGAIPYTGSAIPITVPAASGPAVQYAAYYIKVTDQASGAAAYSQRFILTGVTGAFKTPAIEAAAKQAAAQGDAAVPANIAGAGGAAGAASSGQANFIAFSLQTGTIKTAPMQQKPGTSITAQNTSPLYPTSAWSVFTTMAPIPSQISTVTPSATYSASSRENTASPAALPSNDMAKYLARWRD